MKRLLTAAALALMLVHVEAQQYQRVNDTATTENVPLAEFAAAQKTLFNFGWKFCLVSDENRGFDFASPDLDDSSWRVVDLPHDFQFEQPWTESAGGARGFKPMCEGWYRKSFRAEPDWKGKRVLIDFGGIIYLGDVFLNGQRIASSEYGYVGFEADMSDLLNYGGDNLLAVYASTGKANGSRWYTGGGIFRDVYIRLQNPTHIARHGVYITTPSVSDVSASVAVQVEVDGWQKHDVTVKTVIYDPDGIVIGSASTKMPEHTLQKTTEVKLPEIMVCNPALWSCESPALYSADVILSADGITVDSIRESFGIRSAEFSPEFGFKLNGKKVFLKGVADHHDLGALGAAAYDRAIERLMLRLKEFGYNAIRCSHNPYSESFVRIADRLGILIVDELIDKWSDDEYWGGRVPFTHIWHKLIPEWVKRDRNRPSVILWSLGNELQTLERWTGFDGFNDWGVTTYRVFDQVVKRFDSSRLTTVAMFPARAGGLYKAHPDFNSYLVPPELACATEVASFNYQSNRYKNYLEYKPDLILFQSEATTSILLEPYYDMDRDRMVGIAYWGAVEYWGESNGWPKKGWNYSFFDHCLNPYPQAYLTRTAFVPDVPQVHIGVVDTDGSESISWNDVIVGKMAMSENWNRKVGSKLGVFTFTNAHAVELFNNGISLGVQLNDTTKTTARNLIYWQNVDYGNGGYLEAVATDDSGNVVARHKIETAGDAVTLRIEPETPDDWKADGMDLQYVNITAVDKKGRTVYGYSEIINVEVAGAADFYAMDSGDHYTADLFNGVTSKKMYRGKMQVVLRSQQTPGNVQLNVSSGKLKAKLKLQTK